ncbi:TonB-dependent receptor [Pedobacter sp. HDW13]|uniref:SusC/RagA family TonB-linked outer membrane protein n=1 Tax=Pedobacter sp. HDW13 TaxID=2714940 RepID=UPI001F0EE4AF|nr:TonB-dependent receptor [Pedobacter sp. HDW13]
MRLKDGKQSVKTNEDGKYSITGSGASDILLFSHIGYLERAIAVGERTAVDVVLEVDQKALSEVVVVGYGSKSRKDLTTAVGSVDMGDFTKAPVRSLDEALAGRVAGVQVTSTDGQPGASASIQIRGANSVTQSNSPLYVIDGFPVEGFNLNNISNNEIESINVLKDAAATAIYGARAANGVIVITTKKGVSGSSVVNFNSYVNISSNNQRMELMSPYEFIRYNLDRNPIQGPNTFYYYMVDFKGLNEQNYVDFYKNFSGADWQKPFFQTGYQQNYDLALRGGTDRTTYSLSGNINRQTGTIINTGYKRYQGRFNLDHKVNDKLKVGMNTSYSNNIRYGQGASAGLGGGAGSFILYNVWGYSPIDTISELPIQDVTQALNGIHDYRFNPILHQKNAVSNYKTENININSFAEYAILPSLKLRVSGIYNRSNEANESFNNSLTQYGSPVGWNAANGVNGSITLYKYQNWANENTLTYSETFNEKHRITALAGFSALGSNSEAYGYSARLLPNEQLGLSGLNEGTLNPGPTAESSLWRNSSVYSRVSYSYADKYMMEVSYRADGTSRFAQGNRWGFFPAVSAGWRFSKESFLKDNKIISDGKLRLSYGETGNNRASDFAYVARFELPGNINYSFNNAFSPILFVGKNDWGDISMGNKKLKWETTAQYNAGIDLSLFSNKIGLTVDFYTKKTHDLILNASIPQYSGYTRSLLNIGSVQNTGLEFTITTKNIKTKDFSWGSNFNISFNKNKLLALADGQETLLSAVNWDFAYSTVPAYMAKVDEPLGLMYGWMWDGNYQFSDFNRTTEGVYVLKDEVTTNGNVRELIRPGDIKYKDINGDKVVDANDRTVIGRSLPIHIGGFSNNFRYKSIDLNVFLQWSYGNQIQNNNRFVFEGNALGKSGFQQFASYSDRWSPDNQSSPNYRAGVSGGGYYGTGLSSRTIEDGSYLRLKTVSLGYNFSQKLLQKAKIKSARLSMSAQNLLTWTKYSGFDPEVSTFNNVLTGGFDYSAYPRAKVISFGLDVTF